MKNWKQALKLSLCLLPIALIGGYFALEMSISMIDPAALETAISQVGSLFMVKVMSAVSSAAYVCFAGFFGYLIAEKIWLLHPIRFEKTALLRVLVLSAIGGAILSLDAWTFAKWVPALGETYPATGSFDFTVWIASILYGGISEEILIRFFLMSLIALMVWKVFFKKEETVPAKALIAANFIAAFFFAAGHLPVTALIFGALTPLLLIRCFMLNGAAGLLFGRFYRKYGIQYAIIAHMLFHLVSRTIWLIAIP